MRGRGSPLPKEGGRDRGRGWSAAAAPNSLIADNLISSLPRPRPNPAPQRPQKRLRSRGRRPCQRPRRLPAGRRFFQQTRPGAGRHRASRALHPGRHLPGRPPGCGRQRGRRAGSHRLPQPAHYGPGQRPHQHPLRRQPALRGLRPRHAPTL
ncbi:MAG: hypothetical protein WKG07_44515 [Hymenobacter sp.]